MSGILPQLPLLFLFLPYMALSSKVWVTEFRPRYECNLLSELFVFTGNPLNPSRKHLLKCKRQGEIDSHPELGKEKTNFCCSPKGI